MGEFCLPHRKLFLNKGHTVIKCCLGNAHVKKRQWSQSWGGFLGVSHRDSVSGGDTRVKNTSTSKPAVSVMVDSRRTMDPAPGLTG